MELIAKTAINMAIGSAIFVIVIWSLLLGIKTTTVIGCLALVPLGGAVVGALLASSFLPEDH